MFREVKNAHFARRLTLFGWRYHLVLAKKASEASWKSKRHRAMQPAQSLQPTAVLSSQGRMYWVFDHHFYWDDDELRADDVRALIRDRERRQQRKLERAHAAMAVDGEGIHRREVIPREIRLAVFERDGGRCAECDSNFDIQYDHIIPFSMGGASTLENLQILCADCNRAKGASLA